MIGGTEDSPLKAKFEDDKNFLSTEELIPQALELDGENAHERKASESLLKAFIQSKPDSGREHQEIKSIYRDITLSSVNIRQMLAILF